jgi:hypothetical protein
MNWWKHKAQEPYLDRLHREAFERDYLAWQTTLMRAAQSQFTSFYREAMANRQNYEDARQMHNLQNMFAPRFWIESETGR